MRVCPFVLNLCSAAAAPCLPLAGVFPATVMDLAGVLFGPDRTRGCTVYGFDFRCFERFFDREVMEQTSNRKTKAQGMGIHRKTSFHHFHAEVKTTTKVIKSDTPFYTVHLLENFLPDFQCSFQVLDFWKV